MCTRFMSIWFRHLTTDWLARRRPELKEVPFVFAMPVRGRKLIKAVNGIAAAQGVAPGMVVADAKAILPALQVFDEEPGLTEKLLKQLAIWCIRYTPFACVDNTDGLMLDISGCAHLWGGERAYLKQIVTRLRTAGYDARAAIADTPGAAWAVARYGRITPIIEPGQQIEAILFFPPAALRLEPSTAERLQKLGLYRVKDFIHIPRTALRRRFGQGLLDRIDQASGRLKEPLEPVVPPVPFRERLPCLEPVRTATAIEIALKQLLETLCKRLLQEDKGLRTAIFKGLRIDGSWQQIEIGTNRPVRNIKHLYRLFEQKIETIEPALGIELFVLEAPVIEELPQAQEALWHIGSNYENTEVANLIDRLTGRLGPDTVCRYLPDEHYWPERSYKSAGSFEEKPTSEWPVDRPRPVILLSQPERIEVSAPVPDYPPMLFRWRGKVHNTKKADGVERIEAEWWTDKGLHRDYYCIEDQDGARYWVFRLGHYGEGEHRPEWYLHGFFA